MNKVYAGGKNEGANQKKQSTTILAELFSYFQIQLNDFMHYPMFLL